MCPDIWRSLTLNSRYASPVKKKGNAEKSEACVDLAKKSSSHPSYRKTIFNISQISLSLRSTEKKNVLNYIYIYIITIPKILKYRSQYSSILSHFSFYNYIQNINKNNYFQNILDDHHHPCSRGRESEVGASVTSDYGGLPR